MARCDYDAVFYRLFCIVLLAIAFTVTVMLTNVFIDLDGLLTNKQGKHKSPVVINNIDSSEDFKNDPVTNDDLSYRDNDDYRTKRSIETQNVLLHIKDPKIQKILTNYLSSLLDTLEEKHVPPNLRSNVKNKEKDKPNKEQRSAEDKNEQEKIDKNQEEKIRRQKDEDMLHLTMHNIFLQGIIGHMDINDVQKRMSLLMRNFDNNGKNKDNKNLEEGLASIQLQQEEVKSKQQSLDHKFITELIKWDQAEDLILDSSSKTTRKSTSELKSTLVNPRLVLKTEPEKHLRSTPLKIPQRRKPDIVVNNHGSNVLIKTVIDIKPIGNDRNDTISKDNIQGIVELIYNGQSIKFTQPDEEMKQVKKKPILNIIQPKYTKTTKIPIQTTTKATIIDSELKKIPTDYLLKFVSEFFKHYPKKDIEMNSKEKVTKRLKRFTKIKKCDNENSHHSHSQKCKNNDEEDLYVEIETHIDSKGLKGEKKKQIIQKLIEKIRRAIHSDKAKVHNKDVKKKPHRLIVKKRMQSPLPLQDSDMIIKHNVPVTGVIHRQLNPIPIHRNIPIQEYNSRDKSEDYPNQEYINPYVINSKDTNSAENIEYTPNQNNVMGLARISQRIQKPLNNEGNEENNPFYDYGNMKFFIKDMDGSGFSIGFNQYVDEAPASETSNLFAGLENILKSYHEDLSHDQNANAHWSDTIEDGPNKNDHMIVRRSINKEHDTFKKKHNNAKKVPPYNDYKVQKHGIDNSITNLQVNTSNEQFNETSVIFDDNFFEKKLSPAEIFSLADLLKRRKRSYNFHTIRNLRRKYRFNTYLNTNARSPTKMIFNGKRDKRQTSTFKIISSDGPHKHSSDENVFVISDDNTVFGDRTIFRDFETSEFEPEKPEGIKFIPYQTEGGDTHAYKLFDTKSSHSALMSKYPHVFMEEVSKSKEEYNMPDSALLLSKLPAFSKLAAQAMKMIKFNDKNAQEPHTPQVVEGIKASDLTDKMQKPQDPPRNPLYQSPKTKYKVTVNILPKNLTAGEQPDYKEVHTSINKKFNKNGLHYSTMVNVSEISKVTKINKTKDLKEEYLRVPDYNKDACLAKKLKEQQEKIKQVLRLHKKNINEQLNHLKEEKSKVESIIANDEDPIRQCDNIDGNPHKHSNKGMCLSSDDNEKLAVRQHFKEPVVSTTTTATTITTTTQNTTPTTIITTSLSLFNEKLKKNILHTIERNENMTHQIIKKIDKNTKILQSFLNKLSDRIVNQHHENKDDKTDRNTTSNEYPVDMKMNLPPIALDPMFLTKNNSDVSIPFVYAMQQPIMRIKSDTPMASLIYQGHIHASRLKGEDAASAEKAKGQLGLNMRRPPQTKSSAEDLDNLYRIIPVVNGKPETQKN